MKQSHQNAVYYSARNVAKCIAALGKRFTNLEFDATFSESANGFNIQALDIITGRCDVRFVQVSAELRDSDAELTESMTVWVTDLLREEQ